MNGIRWIIGLPLGYGIYKLVMWINYQIIFFLVPKLHFIPEVLWQIESLIVNGIIAIYIALAFTYLFLPKDEFAVVNNIKVKVIYWAICVWSILQMVIFGTLIYDAINNYQDGMVFQILYVPLVIFSMWFIYKAIALLDFKYNQPARDYIEHMRLQEEAG